MPALNQNILAINKTFIKNYKSALIKVQNDYFTQNNSSQFEDLELHQVNLHTLNYMIEYHTKYMELLLYIHSSDNLKNELSDFYTQLNVGENGTDVVLGFKNDTEERAFYAALKKLEEKYLSMSDSHYHMFKLLAFGACFFAIVPFVLLLFMTPVGLACTIGVAGAYCLFAFLGLLSAQELSKQDQLRELLYIINSLTNSNNAAVDYEDNSAPANNNNPTAKNMLTYTFFSEPFTLKSQVDTAYLELKKDNFASAPREQLELVPAGPVGDMHWL
jgi:hypothetical protein